MSDLLPGTRKAGAPAVAGGAGTRLPEPGAGPTTIRIERQQATIERAEIESPVSRIGGILLRIDPGGDAARGHLCVFTGEIDLRIKDP